MSVEIDDGGKAFPNPESGGGMTLRDYFAGQAITGIIIDTNLNNLNQWVGQEAYKVADAMIAARGKIKPHFR
jgi:hypothetical protein